MVMFLVMLDESMVEWRLEITQYSGLPNITFEPRKPDPIGTMLRDAVDCLTGMFVFHCFRSLPSNALKNIISLSLLICNTAHSLFVNDYIFINYRHACLSIQLNLLQDNIKIKEFSNERERLLS